MKETPESKGDTLACKELKPELAVCTFEKSKPCEDKGAGEVGECQTKEDKSPMNCPKCGKPDNVVKIVFGLPTPELTKQADAGEVALGGCCMPGPEDPSRNYKCKTCNEEF